ncbi:unnamed protein product [Phaedon cochleariae]|uniref:Dimethyladenosine transferase 2, mitochondrial n=1 Tax=Phaedon cochleariae TaxID=80249 RepID=A0A9N9SFL6_PHACE|nr:unnamed protein product [Phaedon cochleariae]
MLYYFSHPLKVQNINSRLKKQLIRLFGTKTTQENKRKSTSDVYTFLRKPHLVQVGQYIPPQYKDVVKFENAEHFYLICPEAAKQVVSLVLPSVDMSGHQLIAETNAGLGLISTELLENGVQRVRMYESCPDFRKELMNFNEVYPGRIELFTKDIFQLPRFAYIDNMDNANRVHSLLKNVPKRAWIDEPSMTIIGFISSLTFIKYLIKSLALQSGPISYGRIQLFAFMKHKDYAILTAGPEENLNVYQVVSILFNMLFDYELIQRFPRDIFLPWEHHSNKRVYVKNHNHDEIYLVKVNYKKDLPVKIEQLLPLYFFIRQFYGKGNKKIIPTIEKWVPDCGRNIIVPTLDHEMYFENINIFTRFRELTPTQILSIFMEMVNNPTYKGSPFTAMIENSLLKTETVETYIADATLERNFIEDMEEKFD